MKKISSYATSKPYTRWWWFNTKIKEKDIKFQLDWLKKNNFGGVEIAWVYPLPKQPKGPEWLSQELSELITLTKKYADHIGLGCDFTFGSLWPFGGTFIEEQDRARVFNGFSEQRLDRTWERDSGKPSYIINHLDKKALENYSKIMGAALKEALRGKPAGSPAYRGKTSALFCDSWEVETQNLWTPGFDKAFENRFGYSINEFMGKLDDFPEVRYDYRKLIAEYILNEFYKPFTEICHKLGAVARVQCHGSPTDLLAAYSSVDIPESEALLFNPSFSIIPASAAALSEKHIVSCETFTCLYGWVTYPGPGPYQKKEQTADLKLLADALFANGINQIVWHGMPYNPKGGKNRFYATVHVGPDSHFADEIPAFNAYMEKVSDIMKKGRTYSDVAVYLPVENAWAYNKLPDEQLKPSAMYHWEMHYNRPATELKGYHPLWVSNYFLKNAKCVKKQLICGASKFSLLYVYVNWLDREALVEILRLAKKGLPICLINQPKEPGKIKHPDYNKMVDALMKLKNVSSDFPKTAVNPPLIIGEHLPDYWCRVDGDEMYIFFAHPRAQNLTYPMPYGHSHTKEAIKKTIAINIGDSFKYTDLVFAPYKSILLHITKKGEIKNIDIKFVPQTPRTPSLLREIKKELKS